MWGLYITHPALPECRIRERQVRFSIKHTDRFDTWWCLVAPPGSAYPHSLRVVQGFTLKKENPSGREGFKRYTNIGRGRMRDFAYRNGDQWFAIEMLQVCRR